MEMTLNNATGSITTNVREREFVMERSFDAPRELVFKMFTQPEHLARWWAPSSFTIPVCKIDLRPDGVWYYCMRSPEGDDQWIQSIYREIIEPERIVYTCTFVDVDGIPVGGPPEQLGTVTFTEYEGKTKLSVCIQLTSADDLKTTLDMGMVEGLSETLNNLANLLKDLQAMF
jgi:uncharacterized protein YndB with AHSA1/START domain